METCHMAEHYREIDYVSQIRDYAFIHTENIGLRIYTVTLICDQKLLLGGGEEQAVLRYSRDTDFRLGMGQVIDKEQLNHPARPDIKNKK